MLLFIASLATETNTFAPFPTAMAGFEEYGIVRDGSRGDGPFAAAMQVFREQGQADGHDIVESISAFAQPSGPTVRRVYEGLRDMILDDLQRAGPVDVVLLMLHGAMVAEGYDDCEGDIIGRIRAICPDAVIGVELDPHCHLTKTMIEESDVIVIAKEYPHVDFADRAHELYKLCTRTARREISPIAVLADLRMVGFYPTFASPMREIVDEMKAAETPPVLSVSLAHGFPWGDTADTGTRVLVYADDDAEAAKAVASRFAERLYTLRSELAPNFPKLADSLLTAHGLNGRVVLGDFADNPGGGAPGDSTFFLKAVLESGIKDVAMAAFWDPQVARIAADAGVGAKVSVRLGGKSGTASGDPLDLEVEVRAVKENFDAGVFGQRQPMGLTAWLHVDGVDIVVCSVRCQVYEPDAFTGLGITLTDKRLVVVKSSNHYQAGFQGHADHLWHVATPGALSLDFANMPYVKRDGEYHPRIPDPWSLRGPPVGQVFRRPKIAA